MKPDVIDQMLERWLQEAEPGERFVYHRGELARSKQHDPNLARVAERMLHLSNGRFDVVSNCGHIRSQIVGDGSVQLLTQRVRGETLYIAQRRKA